MSDQEEMPQPQETSGQDQPQRTDMNPWYSDENRFDKLEKKIAYEFDGEFFRCDYCSVGNSIREDINEHLVDKKHYSASKYESFVNNNAVKKVKLVEKLSIINDDAKKSVLIICPFKKCRLMSSNIFEATEHFMSQHCIPHPSMLRRCYMTRKVILEQECTLDWNIFENECSVCKTRFSDKEDMYQHYSKTRHYLSKLDITPTFLREQGEMLICPYCSDSRCFETLIHLINHQKYHEDKAEGVNKFTLFQTEKKMLFKLSENGLSIGSHSMSMSITMKRKREELESGWDAIELTMQNKKSCTTCTSESEEGSKEICNEKYDFERLLSSIENHEERKLAEQFEGEFFRCDYCSIDSSRKEMIRHHLVNENHHSASMFESAVNEEVPEKKKIKLEEKMSVVNESAKNKIISLCPDLNCRNKFYSNRFDCTDHIVENHCQESPNSSSKRYRYSTQDVLTQQDCVIDLRTNQCIKQRKKCRIRPRSRENLVKHYMKTNHFMNMHDQKKGMTTMLICTFCAALEKNCVYKTYHTDIRSLLEHDEQTHNSEFLHFKVFQCVNKKWFTFTKNGISINFTKQQNKSNCPTATSNINETVLEKAKESKVSDVDFFKEMIPNVKVKEEVLSNVKVSEKMMPDISLNEETVSDSGVNEEKVLEIHVKEMASNASVSKAMVQDIRVKEENVSDSTAYEKMTSDLKVKDEKVSVSEVCQEMLINVKVKEEIMPSNVQFYEEMIPDITVKEVNVSVNKVFEEIVPDIKIKEETVLEGEVYGEMVPDVKVKDENISVVQIFKDKVPEIKVKIEMDSNVQLYEEMIPDIEVKEEIVSGDEAYTEMFPEPDIKIKEEMVSDI